MKPWKVYVITHGLALVAALALVVALTPTMERLFNKPTKSPAVKETICPVGMHPDRHFEYLIKCADWRKG